jgi:hypothetical protein
MFRIRPVVLVFVFYVASVGSLVRAGEIGITNWYHVELWRFPDPPQDVSNLPGTPEEITYNESVHTEFTSQSFDKVFEGDAPRSGPGMTSQISTRVAANSDFTHLRAAFHTTVAEFQASNFRPGYYEDAEGSHADLGDWSGQTFVATVVDELFTLTGPGPSTYDLTYVLNVSGSNTSNVTVSGSGYLEPWTSGIISAYGSETYGPYFELPHNDAVNQTVFLTVQANNNAPTFTRLAMSFSNYLLGYPNWLSDDEAAVTFLDGSFLWDYDTTASIEKLIVGLPLGADPADYTFTAGSGTNYNVEFRTSGSPVPEPGMFCLFAVGLAGILALRIRQAF